MQKTMVALKSVAQGIREASPLVLGLFPIGIAFGLAARALSFGLLITSLMSLAVYAGASQFVGIALIVAAASVPEVALTTFVINLRHALMGSSLSVYLPSTPRPLLPILAFGLTDESYALSLPRFASGKADAWYLLGVELICYLSWNTGTLAGHWGGEVLPTAVREAMAFALPAMFIALLAILVRNRLGLAVAAFSALVSMGLFLAGVSGLNVVVVGVVGATFGLLLERGRAKWKAP